MKSIVCFILISVAVSSCQHNTAEAEIKAAMLDFISESTAPGIALGYYSEKIGTIMLATGKADTEKGIPLEISTPYPIQSTTKMFMSILTLQLIDEGKISLESSIDEWMDSVPNSDQISIRHLLTHTSGLSNPQRNEEFMVAYFSDSSKEYTRNDIIHAGLEISQESNLGKGEYSGTNYLILACIIEALTGKSIGQVLDQRIFHPARMEHSYYKPEFHTDTTDIAKCYRFGEAIDLDKWNFLANAGGGIVSTIEDMLSFAHWIKNSKYPQIMAHEAEQFDLYNLPDLSTRYALGIEIDDNLFGVPMLGHSGGNPGLIHEFRFSPETGEILIYFLNEGRAGKSYGDLKKDLELILQKYR